MRKRHVKTIRKRHVKTIRKRNVKTIRKRHVKTIRKCRVKTSVAFVLNFVHIDVVNVSNGYVLVLEKCTRKTLVVCGAKPR